MIDSCNALQPLLNRLAAACTPPQAFHYKCCLVTGVMAESSSRQVINITAYLLLCAGDCGSCRGDCHPVHHRHRACIHACSSNTDGCKLQVGTAIPSVLCQLTVTMYTLHDRGAVSAGVCVVVGGLFDMQRCSNSVVVLASSSLLTTLQANIRIAICHCCCVL